MTAWIPFAVALLVVAGLTPVVRSISLRVGFVDRPTARRFHSRAVALGGGVALATGVAAACLTSRLPIGAAGDAYGPISPWVPIGGIVVALLGLVDDLRGMHPLVKLSGQVLAALALVESVVMPVWFLPVAVVWCVALMNACNFLDNMDGILAGIGLLCGLAFFWITGAAGPLAVLSAAVAGASLGFLIYNAPPARIFMGDVGSLVIGYLLAALSLGVVAGEPGGWAWGRLIGVALIVGYPIFDITFVTMVRSSEGRSVALGGRDHTTHRLHNLVGHPLATALLVYALTAVVAVAGVVVLTRRTSIVAVALALVVAMGLVGLGIRLRRVPVS